MKFNDPMGKTARGCLRPFNACVSRRPKPEKSAPGKPWKLMNGGTPIAATNPRESFRGRRILVVDDDEAARYLDCMMLLHAGYSVDTAADGEEAWQMLLSHPYDLLLSDHNMPRLSGLDLVVRMRAAGMTLPIILNSGWLGLGDASNHPSLDLAAVLHKPFDFTELLNAVKRILPLPLEKVQEAVHNGHVPLNFALPVAGPVRIAGQKPPENQSR
jgi:CheY-like chemotaxis protein